MNKSYLLYLHTVPKEISGHQNDKYYVGITSNSTIERWGSVGNGYKHQKHFWNAIQKYGWENIKHTILFQNLTREEACELEKEYIKFYHSDLRMFGYNKSSGGESGGSPTKNIAQYDINGELLNVYPNAVIAAKELGVSSRGGNISRAAKTGDISHGFQWRYFDYYPLKKIDKKIYKTSINRYSLTGEYIDTWDSIQCASNALHISYDKIKKACERKQLAGGGFQWRHYDDSDVSDISKQYTPR